MTSPLDMMTSTIRKISIEDQGSSYFEQEDIRKIHLMNKYIDSKPS